MTESLVARQYLNVTPPRAGINIVGEPAAFAVTTTAGALDLRSISNPATDLSNVNKSQRNGAVGQYITIFADGADLGLVFGKTFASVSSANVPALATVGTVDGSTGVYTGVVKTCIRVPSGTFYDVNPTTEDLFMGFVGSTTGVCRVWQSSPSNP